MHTDISKLGIHPLLLVFLQFTAVCPVAGGLVYALIAATGDGGKGPGGAIALFGLIPWSLGSFWLGIKLLALLVSWGGYAYRRTRKAVQDGRIGITYCLRDGQGAFFIVVDEDRKLVAVNGQIIAFGAVREVGWETGDGKNTLKFTLNSGTNPLVLADLGDADSLKTGYARICNSIGIG